MNEFIELTDDQFAELYKPLANHLNPNASFDWGDGYGTLFETFGPELAFVRSQQVNHIWTLLDGDDGLYVASGYHFVNRLGYFVTKNPLPAHKDALVTLDEID